MKKYSELNLKLLSFHTKSPIAAVVISVVVHNRRQKYTTNSLFDIAAHAFGVETYIYWERYVLYIYTHTHTHTHTHLFTSFLTKELWL